jgi:preprotein translocase subunit SecY
MGMISAFLHSTGILILHAVFKNNSSTFLAFLPRLMSSSMGISFIIMGTSFIIMVEHALTHSLPGI